MRPEEERDHPFAILCNYIPHMKLAPLPPKTTSDRLTTVLSYGALLLLIYLVFLIVSPFFVPLAWSAVFAIFFYPLHERLEQRMKPNGAALVSTTAVTVLLIAPAIIVLVFATRQAIEATTRLQAALMDPDKELSMHTMAWIHGHLPSAWQDWDITQPIRQGAERIAGFIAEFRGAAEESDYIFCGFVHRDLFAVFYVSRRREHRARREALDS